MAVILSLAMGSAVAFANAMSVLEPSVRPSDLKGAEFFISLFGCAAAIVASGVFLLFHIARGARVCAREERLRGTDTR